MKSIVFTLAAVLLQFSIIAQESAAAKQLLDEVADKVATYENIYIEFDHTLDNRDADVHQETKGNVTLKGDLYRLNYMGTEQLFDGDKIFLIIHEDEEVIIQSPSESEDETLTPSKMFSFYQNGYTYSMGDLKNENGRMIQYVNLTPIDSNSEILEILVGIDVKTKHIFSIREIGENSTLTTLKIRNFKTNQRISEHLFVFDRSKYADEKNYTISETN